MFHPSVIRSRAPLSRAIGAASIGAFCLALGGIITFASVDKSAAHARIDMQVNVAAR